MAAVCEAQLETSGFYHTALDTLMDSLQISSSPSLEPARCNNSFRRHFSSADEDKFFSFCSTIKQYPKSDNVVKDRRSHSNKQQNLDTQNEVTRTPTSRSSRDTPKRSLTTTRKQKLFSDSSEDGEEFKPKTRTSLRNRELSPQSLLLKKAITRFECLQRRQERIALSKKPMRTSLRV